MPLSKGPHCLTVDSHHASSTRQAQHRAPDCESHAAQRAPTLHTCICMSVEQLANDRLLRQSTSRVGAAGQPHSHTYECTFPHLSTDCGFVQRLPQMFTARDSCEKQSKFSGRRGAPNKGSFNVPRAMAALTLVAGFRDRYAALAVAVAAVAAHLDATQTPASRRPSWHPRQSPSCPHCHSAASCTVERHATCQACHAQHWALIGQSQMLSVNPTLTRLMISKARLALWCV